MPCEACEKAHKDGKPRMYIWKYAKIQMKGCDRHLDEMFQRLDSIQEGMVDEK